MQCLKEWAVTCAALGAGLQTVLVRKGGIREPTFTPKAQRFLLFPTAFHSDAQLLKPGIAEQFHEEMVLQPKEVDQLRLQYYAEVTGSWTTQDPEVLAVLDPLHVYAEGFLDTRLKWRAKEPLTLLELRCYRLQRPLLLPVKQREGYFGCFSWVQLEDADVLPPGCWEVEAALGDAEFAAKQAVLWAGLQRLQAEELVL